ncbi:MAG: YtxH domain-containing protein [Anaerolineales bacterium]
MADNDDSDFGAFFTGFVIGGLVGAAVALILAPQSGEETRAQLRQRSIELRDQAYDTAEDARRRAEDAAMTARERAEQASTEALSRAEKLAAEARARTEELAERGKAVYEEQREKITTRLGRKSSSASEGAVEIPSES